MTTPPTGSDPEIQMLDSDGWAQLFRDTHTSAYHLEMRDDYAVEEEDEHFNKWRAGEWDADHEDVSRSAWLNLMRETRDRGVQLHRVRIVSEPVTEYIRFEHAITPSNIAAGEQVRWVRRTRASGLALPGNDCWVFDSKRVLFNHFNGSGNWLGSSLTTDPEVAELCTRAFESAWAIGTPHEQYLLV